MAAPVITQGDLTHGMIRCTDDAVQSGLAGVDVNLLVALDVLLQERHVTRAARRVGVTQSAMSQTLQRLRLLLDDPLLVRRGAAMIPTPRAEALAPALRAALRSLEHALAPPTFDPATSGATFRIALFDVYAISLVPRLIAALASRAPGVRLEVLAADLSRIKDQLRDGEVDAGVYVPRETAGDIASECVLEEGMVSIVRVGHPVVAGPEPPTLEDVLRWPHLRFRITGRGGSAVDDQLAAQGASRRVTVQLAYFLSAPAILCASDLIATVPASAAAVFARQWPLATFRSPFGPMPLTVRMTWARHLDADPAQVWFREQIRAAAAALAPSPG
jgi:DNA-binding transcriptional LysR family regulator